MATSLATADNVSPSLSSLPSSSTLRLLEDAAGGAIDTKETKTYSLLFSRATDPAFIVENISTIWHILKCFQDVEMLKLRGFTADFVEKFKNAINSVLSTACLHNYWDFITGTASTSSSLPLIVSSLDDSILESIELVYALHRSISNFFKADLRWFISSIEYDKLIEGSYSKPNFCIIVRRYKELSTNIKYSLCRVMQKSTDFLVEIVSTSSVSSDGCELLLSIMQSILKISSAQPSKFASSKSTVSCIHMLLPVILKKVSYDLVFEQFILKRAHDRSIAEAVISCLPAEALVDCCDVLCSNWSSPYFISKSHQGFQEYWTESLLLIIDRMDKEELYEEGPSGVSITSLLSYGVSKYLDINDEKIRTRGMRVAVRFSAKLGHKLSFDELPTTDSTTDSGGGEVVSEDGSLNQSDNGNGSSSLTIDAQSESAIMRINSDSGSNSKTNDSKNNITSNNSSSDDDSDEFEAYSIVEPSSLPDVSYYLRDCLEYLQSPDSKPESFELHKKALISIPIIISNSPQDAKFNCAELTRELLRIRNSFNIDNFSELREKALLHILISYPSLSIPVVIQSIEDPDLYSVGAKLAAVSSISKASLALAGLEAPPAAAVCEVPSSAEAIDDKSKIKKSNASEAVSAAAVLQTPIINRAEDISKKTKIKRPLLLASRKKKSVYFRNKFGDVASYVFYPLLRTLMESLQQLQNKPGSDWSIIDAHLEPALQAAATLNNNYSNSSGNGSRDIDAMDVMLPAKLIQALGIFTKCSSNTNHQRDFITNTLRMSVLLKDFKNLEIRRGALFAILCSFESINAINNDMSSRPLLDENSGSVLGSLMNITSNPDSTSTGVGGAFMIETVIAIVDWVLKALQIEADIICRAYFVQIGQIGLNIIESFKK